MKGACLNTCIVYIRWHRLTETDKNVMIFSHKHNSTIKKMVHHRKFIFLSQEEKKMNTTKCIFDNTYPDLKIWKYPNRNATLVER